MPQEGVSAPSPEAPYPLAEIDRPLTLPKKMLRLDASAGIERIAGESELVSGFLLETGATDGMQATLDTGFDFSPEFRWNRHLGFDVRVSLLDTRLLDLAPAFNLVFDFNEDPVTGERDWLQRLEVGLVVRIAVGRLWVQLDGGPALPTGGGNNQVVLDLTTSPNTVAANVGIGGGFQVSDRFAVSGTTLAVRKVFSGPGETTWLLVDEMPVMARALYAAHWRFDLVVEGTVGDLKSPDDYYLVTAGFAFRHQR